MSEKKASIVEAIEEDLKEKVVEKAVEEAAAPQVEQLYGLFVQFVGEEPILLNHGVEHKATFELDALATGMDKSEIKFKSPSGNAMAIFMTPLQMKAVPPEVDAEEEVEEVEVVEEPTEEEQQEIHRETRESLEA